MSEHNEPAGHPMDEIAQQFKAPTESKFGPLSFSPDQIAAPAFFVDTKLCIRWISPNGADAFSQAMTLEFESASTRNIFNLLLRPAIKGALSNWQAFFSFVYILLRRATSRDTFDTETGFISRDHIPSTTEETTRFQDNHPFQVDSVMIGGNESDTDTPLRIFGLGFKEGTLFLIRQDFWLHTVTDDGQKKSPVDAIESVDAKKTICILSARLDDSHRIADTMLAESFIKLMNQIQIETDDTARALGGLRAGNHGAEIQYVFTKSAGRNPIFSAICCATRLNNRMQALEEKLKAEQGWADDIRMNMGISHGTDDLTASESTGTVELMIPGGAADQSSLLSAIAKKGHIWITKNAVGQLPKKQIDQVVIGVDRQGQFLRNLFARISDLPSGVGPDQIKRDMGTLSITRIVGIEMNRPDQP